MNLLTNNVFDVRSCSSIKKFLITKAFFHLINIGPGGGEDRWSEFSAFDSINLYLISFLFFFNQSFISACTWIFIALNCVILPTNLRANSYKQDSLGRWVVCAQYSNSTFLLNPLASIRVISCKLSSSLSRGDSGKRNNSVVRVLKVFFKFEAESLIQS